VRFTAGLLLLALTLAGCESNEERSAALTKHAHHQQHAQAGLSITHRSPYVKVTGTALLHSSEGAAAVVTMRNISANALREVPIEITIKGPGSTTLYENNSPGLEAGLTTLASLPAHGEAIWVDDQVPTSSGPATVSAVVGEAPILHGAAPQIEVSGVHASEETGVGAGAAGKVRNRSNIAQQRLVVYGFARQGRRIVAAGRAVLPEVAAGASVPFQAFLIGAATGARLEASAPATTFE
jgi:hypothetical protein